MAPNVGAKLHCATGADGSGDHHSNAWILRDPSRVVELKKHVENLVGVQLVFEPPPAILSVDIGNGPRENPTLFRGECKMTGIKTHSASFSRYISDISRVSSELRQM
jgi:hypothetical protein